MSYPAIGPQASMTAPSNGTLVTSLASSPAIAVNSGDSIYVFIGYDCGSTGSISVSGVSDTINKYRPIGKKQNPGQTSPHSNASVEIWCADSVAAASSLTVKVTFSAATFFGIVVQDIVGGAIPTNAFDALSPGSTGSGMTSTDPVSTVSGEDLVIAVQCQSDGTGALTSGGGFTNVLFADSGFGGLERLTVSGWDLSVRLPSTVNSSFSWPSTGFPYSILTVAIRSALEYSNLPIGKPSLTVSPIGIKTAQSTLANNGADFGVDTPGTTTGGWNEAVAAAANGTRIVGLPGTFSISNTIQVTKSLTVELAEGCEIQVVNNPTFTSHVESGGIAFSIAVEFSGCSNVRWRGGVIDYATLPATNNNVGAFHVGGNVSNLILEGTTVTNFSRFAYWITAYTDLNGTQDGNVTNVRLVNVEADTCGNTNVTPPDGGGIKLANGSSTFGY